MRTETARTGKEGGLAKKVPVFCNRKELLEEIEVPDMMSALALSAAFYVMRAMHKIYDVLKIKHEHEYE